jgi:hypothetical protein
MKATFINGAVEVRMYGVKLVENCEAKLLSDFDVPKTTAGVQTPEKKVLFLSQLKRAFSITGRIEADSSNQSRTYADEALNDLRDMEKDNEGCQLKITDNAGSNYLFQALDNSTTPIDGFLQKVQFTHSANDVDRPESYDVIAVFLEAVSLK